MGTRSTIGFYKGNEVRYIYVMHDGYDHGDTMEKIGHDACELLWYQIGEAESRGEKIWLSHLLADDADMTGADKPQPTRRTPLPAKGHWNDDYLKRFGFELSGVIKIDTGWNTRVSPRHILDLVNMNGNAWLYDLETDKIFFMGGDDFKSDDLEVSHPVKDSLQWNYTYIEL